MLKGKGSLPKWWLRSKGRVRESEGKALLGRKTKCELLGSGRGQDHLGRWDREPQNWCDGLEGMDGWVTPSRGIWSHLL